MIFPVRNLVPALYGAAALIFPAITSAIPPPQPSSGSPTMTPLEIVPQGTIIDIGTRLNQRRQIIELIYGAYIIITGANMAGDVVADIIQAVGAAMNPEDDKVPFESGSGNCIMHVQTQGGGNCDGDATPAAKSGNTTKTKHDKDWNVCYWDSDSKTSGYQYFNDPGFGKYMIEWTATDEEIGANAGSKGAKCPAQGLCNAILHFYRDGYEIQIHTWESVYNGDERGDGYIGLCSGGVLDQFEDNGDVMGYTCGVPCWKDGDAPSAYE